MDRTAEILGYLDQIAFIGLALLGLRAWVRRRDPASQWFFLTFLVLSGVTIAGLLVDDDSQPLLYTKVVIGVLLMFPYCLYRFTTSFHPSRRPLDIALHTLLGATLVWTAFLSDFPEEGEDRPAWFVGYLVMFLLTWTALSMASAIKLWRAGHGEPHLAQQRMRLLAAGSLILNLALVLSAFAPSGERNAGIDLLVQLAVLTSALAFYLGFAPPPLLRTIWRRPEQSALRGAMGPLMTATREEEVTEALLPHVAGMFGGRTAVMLDREGRVIGSHGASPEVEAELGSGVTEPLYLKAELPTGALLVRNSVYSPFFGGDDQEILTSVARLAELALQRIRHLEREREQLERLERINAELADAQAVAQLGSWEWIVGEDRIKWSDELFRIFGVDPDDFEASYEDYLMLIHPDDRDAVNLSIDRAQRTGEFHEIDHKVQRPDGSIRWVRSRGRVIKDAQGTVERMIGTAQDITERKMAEEYERELRDASVRQRQALELNDNIVQGLAVAGMALEIGQVEKAKEAIAKTMSAAQSIITGLLRSSEGRGVEPGDLIRSTAATLEEETRPR